MFIVLKLHSCQWWEPIEVCCISAKFTRFFPCVCARNPPSIALVLVEFVCVYEIIQLNALTNTISVPNAGPKVFVSVSSSTQIYYMRQQRIHSNVISDIVNLSNIWTWRRHTTVYSTHTCTKHIHIWHMLCVCVLFIYTIEDWPELIIPITPNFMFLFWQWLICCSVRYIDIILYVLLVWSVRAKFVFVIFVFIVSGTLTFYARICDILRDFKWN